MKIYLVRHGETEENIKRTYYGSIDCELTENGLSQGKKLGKALKEVVFDKVYCSEKKRAKNTLKEIYKGEVIIDKRINERDFGIFEGKTYKDIQREYKGEHEIWCKEWKEYYIPKGESFKVFYKRVKSFMEDLKDLNEENILICTHGGVVQSIYTYVLGDNLDMYWKFASRNGDLSIIRYEDGFFYIDSIISQKFIKG